MRKEQRVRSSGQCRVANHAFLSSVDGRTSGVHLMDEYWECEQQRENGQLRAADHHLLYYVVEMDKNSQNGSFLFSSLVKTREIACELEPSTKQGSSLALRCLELCFDELLRSCSWSIICFGQLRKDLVNPADFKSGFRFFGRLISISFENVESLQPPADGRSKVAFVKPCRAKAENVKINALFKTQLCQILSMSTVTYWRNWKKRKHSKNSQKLFTSPRKWRSNEQKN